jgi:hypothetical protein
MAKPIVAFRSFANEPKEGTIDCILNRELAPICNKGDIQQTSFVWKTESFFQSIIIIITTAWIAFKIS